MISMDDLRKIRNKTEKNNQNDAVIISKADLDRIKDATTIKTKDQLIQEKRLLEEQKQAALIKSKMRKTKMQEMDTMRAVNLIDGFEEGCTDGCFVGEEEGCLDGRDEG